ncbi:unnamed protein product [marine sediment metagenome]|uniref:HTH cro/C1-type domain-containing protein n=1 Tax=marine sediment metagenome TaxID=412755 RepID=X1KBQ4_9ZZZZ
MGISQAFLSRLEKGENAPSLAILEAVCAWRGRDLEWLLFGDEPEETTTVTEALAAEAKREYIKRSRGLELPVVGGGRRELPAGTRAYQVKGAELGPLASAGDWVLLVRANRQQKGPAVVRLNRHRWRIIGKLF